MVPTLVGSFAAVAAIVTLEVPTADGDGVPEIAPVVLFSARPAGSLPAVTDHVKDPFPPVAASAAE